MPLYQYECQNCKEKFEEFKPHKDNEITRCECGAIADKVIARGVLGVLRGKGFTRHNTIEGSSKNV